MAIFLLDQGLKLLSTWPMSESLELTLSHYPKISIISPNYNYAYTIARTIKSIINQKYPNLEYIIIDDGSTDESLEVIKKYEDYLANWQHQENAGQYHAINCGFEQSSGEIMGWLNSDDIYLPWTLHVVAEIFAEFPEVEWIIGRPTQIQNGVIRNVGPLQPYPQEFIASGLFRGDRLGWIQQESVFWRRSLWDKAGPLRTDLKYAADFELWTRFAEHAKLVSVSCILGGFFVRQSNRHRQNLDRYFAELDQVIEEWPPERRDRYHQIWSNLQTYQRIKPYTGIRSLYRKISRLGHHQGNIATWNTDRQCYDLISTPYLNF
jgi:glycosyltransferase involved in cell wall biosynthesis